MSQESGNLRTRKERVNLRHLYRSVGIVVFLLMVRILPRKGKNRAKPGTTSVPLARSSTIYQQFVGPNQLRQQLLQRQRLLQRMHQLGDLLVPLE